MEVRHDEAWGAKLRVAARTVSHFVSNREELLHISFIEFSELFQVFLGLFQLSLKLFKTLLFLLDEWTGLNRLLAFI